MIKTFLMTTAIAVLVAATGSASAQGVKDSQSPAPAAAPTVKAPEGKMEQNLAVPKKSDSVAPATNAQAPQTATDAKPLTTGQGSAPNSAKPAPSAQLPKKADDSKPVTTEPNKAPEPSRPGTSR
jgi:hypothetical protein